MTIPEALDAAATRHQAGHLQEAEAIYQRILSEQPNHATALHLLGYLKYQTGDRAVAEQLLVRALSAKPDEIPIINTLGTVLAADGRRAEAVAAFARVAALQPNVAEAHYNLGVSLQEMGRLKDSIAEYRQALALRADYVRAYNGLGTALREQGEFHEAAASFRQAIALNPQMAEAHANLAGTLRATGELDEAIAACHQALALRPEEPQALMILGTCLVEKGQHDQAMSAYDRALKAQPDYAEAEWCRAVLHLMRGELPEGWKGLECRWRVKELKIPMLTSSRPRWDGSDLNGRRILLNPEQGFGDAIQFVRYARLVKDRGGRVILDCPPPLKRLMQSAEGVEQVAVRGEPLPEFDVHFPLLSLPHLFGTTIQTIPAYVPYLHADPIEIERWRQRLEPVDGRLKVGIVWGGSPTHANERNRSARLHHFLPLAQLPEVRLYSLQKGSAAVQATTPPAGMELVDLTSELNDFADTAALVSNLDLIISVDTSVAHLAGAIAKPVWILLPTLVDYRWMLNRTDSPWYPTARLFRQSRRGDWDGVFTQVRDALLQLVDTRRKWRAC